VETSSGAVETSSGAVETAARSPARPDVMKEQFESRAVETSSKAVEAVHWRLVEEQWRLLLEVLPGLM